MRIRNNSVLQHAGIENSATFISRNRLRWFGHVARMPEERLPKKLSQWKQAHGKRSRARPPEFWLDCVKEDYKTAAGSSPIIGHMIISAANRKEWWMLAKLRQRVQEAGHSSD